MRGQFLRYAGHVAGYIGGTYQTYYTRAQGGTTFEPTPLKKQKESLQWLEKNVLNEPTWMREFDYCKTMTRDTRTLTQPVATQAASLLVTRLSGLNDLYPADKYIADIVRICFAEAQNGKSVSNYRQTLQSTLTVLLTNRFQSLSGTIASEPRANVLLALKSIQSKIKNAGADAKSRAHFQNLSDQIERALVVK